jgi:CRISPR-associated exonuclease Cas4
MMARDAHLETIAQGEVFTVTDLKQFAYCPRVVFYTYCLPLLRPQTYKMQESQWAHREEAGREVRRSLRPYGLSEGEREFDVDLYSPTLGLRGRADMVVTTAEEAIPIDYKQTRREAGAHFRLQLAAYGLVLEEMRGLPVQRGFVYSMLTREAEEIPLTPQRLGRVRRTVHEMREMVREERVPPPPRGRGRCVSCEFRRFCNDL